MTNRILVQVKPGATTLTDAYQAPQGKITMISSIIITNQVNTGGTFRISIAPSGVADSPKQYFFYDTPLCPNETMSVDIGALLEKGDIIRVYSGSGSLSFNILGNSITAMQ